MRAPQMGAAPTLAPDLVPSSDSGASSNDDLTNDSTPTFSGPLGQTAALALIELLEGNTVIGSTTAAPNGSYEVTADELSDGEHVLAVRQTYEGLAPSEPSPTLAIAVDTEPPPAVLVAPELAAISDTGSSDNDDITDDRTPILYGSISADAMFELVAANTVIATGTSAENGVYSVRPEPLVNGSYAVTAREVDAAGNVGPPSEPLFFAIMTWSFIDGITVLVDAGNTGGLENGTEAYPFDSLQKAINAAEPGDVVGVVAGEYRENIRMKSGVTLLGEDPHTTSIVGEADVLGVVLFESVSNATLDGFTITVDQPVSGRDRAVVFRGSATDGTAVIQNSVITGTQYGIYVWSPSTPLIQNNVFDGRPITEEQGIYIGNRSTQPVIRNNVILRYRWGIHVVSPGSQPPIIENNVLWLNEENYHTIGDQTGINGNMEVPPGFVSREERDYHLHVGSPLIDAGSAGEGAPLLDGDREQRPIGTTIDIGIDEW